MKIEDIIKATNVATAADKNANRSNLRTNIMNDGYSAVFQQIFPNCTFKQEEAIDDYSITSKNNQKGKFRQAKFKADVVGYDEDGNVSVVVLLKHINQSYQKNVKNYTNCTIGEITRVLTGRKDKDIKVIFLTIAPSKIPAFGKTTSVQSYMYIKPDIQPVLEFMGVEDKVYDLSVVFDTDEVVKPDTTREQWDEYLRVSYPVIIKNDIKDFL